MLTEVIVFVILVVIWLSSRKRPGRFPPGPKGWPLIGSLSLGKVHASAQDWRKKYGDVIWLILLLAKYPQVQGKMHKETTERGKPRDYIDFYLNEVESTRSDVNSTFKTDLSDLRGQLWDFFSGGTETTSSVLRWLILLLAKYPQVQGKMHKEIDDVIRKGEAVLYSHGDKMPYCKAVMNEVQRVATLVPFAVHHMTTADAQVGQYTVPKGSLVLPNIISCHRDKRYWEKPDEFYPEHFLDSEGNFIQKKDGYLPFSIGRRKCLGESLAKVEYFIFVITIIQAFDIKAAPGETLSTEADISSGFINWAQDFKYIFTERA